MGMSADAATKIRNWEFWGISGEMGLIPPKKWTPSLADECLPHRERGSPRLGEPHTQQVSARSWPTLNHVSVDRHAQPTPAYIGTACHLPSQIAVVRFLLKCQLGQVLCYAEQRICSKKRGKHKTWAFELTAVRPTHKARGGFKATGMQQRRVSVHALCVIVNIHSTVKHVQGR